MSFHESAAIARDSSAPASPDVSLVEPVSNTPVEQVALSRLSLSPHNMRRKAPTGIEGLAVNIAANGIFQNLVVHRLKGSRGKAAMLGVCAGQRRMLALQWLCEAGRIDDSYQVPVKIVSEAEALAVSLIENSLREPMHPADAAVAFRLLVEEGKTTAHIAALFSIPEIQVQRRLKLANVSPRLLDLFRDDGISFEQISTLALTDDHALQERLWFDADQAWQRDARQLRAAITHEEIDVRSSNLVAFVTLEAYEAAGGYVRRDLFSDNVNAGYIADAKLLQRLAADKLLAIAQGESACGWSWVETRIRRDFSEIAQHGRLPSTTRECTKKEKAELRALNQAVDATDKAFADYCEARENAGEEEGDDPRRDELEAQANAATCALDEFPDRLETWSAEQMAQSGVFVTLDHDGEVLIERGLVRPQDRAGHSGTGRDSSGSDNDNGDICHALGMDEPDRPRARPVHSDKLCRRLTAHRTAAVQVELSRNPNVALAVLMNRLIPCVFRQRYLGVYDAHAVGIQATSSHERLLKEADDMEASPAWGQLSAEREKWEAMLPEDFGSLLPWLCEQSAEVMSNLFAFCVAATVDGISGTDSAHPVNVIYDLLDFDIAKYWKPTRASYLAHVSKARIGEVVANAISNQAAAPLATMKKEVAAEAAELRLADAGWVPEIMTNRDCPRAYYVHSGDAGE